MALTTRLVMRQGQSLVMTPQLLQAIKLLQFSHIELNAFIQEELDRNPLLDRAEDLPAPADVPPAIDRYAEQTQSAEGSSEETPDWASPELTTDTEKYAADLGGDATNNFESETGAMSARQEELGLSSQAWSGAASTSGGGDESPNLEAYVANAISLADHLRSQLSIACADIQDRLIGETIIDGIDENGYLREPLEEVATRLGVDVSRVERVLSIIQFFEPSGVGARTLAECLAIQLKERDRFDPAMQALVANLALLARNDFSALKRLCGVDDEDFLDMVTEIRLLDPKPGRSFGGEPIQPVTPDVIVRNAADGGWRVELNPDVMPRLLINQTYAAHVAAHGQLNTERSFITTCLQSANWLTKSLEQRARTILKVASEIVLQQDGFLVHGIEYLRPLNLRAIADAIGMHESTVSRVTSNKYMATPRGLFEMKYFFTAAINAQTGGEAHSAEAVRHRIKNLIEQEAGDCVLSDDAIVEKLKKANIDIARRTVAKYRESLKIPSSVERRREKSTRQLQTHSS